MSDDAIRPADLRVVIQDTNGRSVDRMQLACDMRCVDLLAIGEGGSPPYAFSWSDGASDAARRLCPEIDGTYSVHIRDEASTARPQPSASVTLTRADCDPPKDRSSTPGNCKTFQAGQFVGCGNVGSLSDPPMLRAGTRYTLRTSHAVAGGGSLQVSGVSSSCAVGEALVSRFSLPDSTSGSEACLTPSIDYMTMLLTSISGNANAFLLSMRSRVEVCEGCE